LLHIAFKNNITKHFNDSKHSDWKTLISVVMSVLQQMSDIYFLIQNNTHVMLQ